MLGGDQLSVVRTRSAIKVKARPSKRLEGILPTIEDWHAKLTLLEVNQPFLHNNINQSLYIGYLEIFFLKKIIFRAWYFIPITKFDWKNKCRQQT